MFFKKEASTDNLSVVPIYLIINCLNKINYIKLPLLILYTIINIYVNDTYNYIHVS